MSGLAPSSGSGTGLAVADFGTALRESRSDAERVELLYQSALDARAGDTFAAAVRALYAEAPDNLLFAAWYYRLQRAGADEHAARHAANWRLAAPLSVALGLVAWALSNPTWTLGSQHIPLLAIVWAPITAVALILYLAASAHRDYGRSALVLAALAVATAYVFWVSSQVPDSTRNNYLILMVAHMPLLAACAIGLALLGWGSSARDRFAFLWKGIETVGTAGVAAIAGGIFVGLTYGMFQALSIMIPDLLARLLLAGGAGLIPVLAVAAVYDTSLAPGEQDFRRGFGRVLAILMWALLPLTLIVLVIYICFIPFNFNQPFVNRDVLIVYNAMLFAIVVLLLGVTPVSPRHVPPRWQWALRAGIVLLAGLVVLVGLYALAATIYRTANSQLTINRFTVIGWNVVNIGVLVALLVKQARAGHDGWVDALHGTFRLGTAAYLVWGAALVLVLPWLF